MLMLIMVSIYMKIILSDESCDTEDWINDAENSAFHPMN